MSVSPKADRIRVHLRPRRGLTRADEDALPAHLDRLRAEQHLNWAGTALVGDMRTDAELTDVDVVDHLCSLQSDSDLVRIDLSQSDPNDQRAAAWTLTITTGRTGRPGPSGITGGNMTNHIHQVLATRGLLSGRESETIRREGSTHRWPDVDITTPRTEVAPACVLSDARPMPRSSLWANAEQLRQALRLLLAVAVSAILASCAILDPKQAWRDEPFSLLKGDGDLVKICHTQPGAAAMNENDVFASVAADSNAWYLVKQAQSIRGERDGFIRQGRLDSWYKQFGAEVRKYPRTNLVAFMIGVRIDPYQVSTKQFPLCIDTLESCDERALSGALAAHAGVFPSPGRDQHHWIRRRGSYVLYVNVRSNRTLFSLGAEQDLDLEAYLARTGRQANAFGIARIDNVEENGPNGKHVINATLEGIVLKSNEFVPGETPDYYWMGPAKLDLRF